MKSQTSVVCAQKTVRDRGVIEVHSDNLASVINLVAFRARSTWNIDGYEALARRQPQKTVFHSSPISQRAAIGAIALSFMLRVAGLGGAQAQNFVTIDVPGATGTRGRGIYDDSLEAYQQGSEQLPHSGTEVFVIPVDRRRSGQLEVGPGSDTGSE